MFNSEVPQLPQLLLVTNLIAGTGDPLFYFFDNFI